MKSKLLAWLETLRAMGRGLIGRFVAFMMPRQALKRGLLVAAVFGLGASVLLPVFGTTALFIWALGIAAVFLGLGAKRASLSWGDTFALPALQDFVFWRWTPLERRRYWAVLTSLAACLLVSVLGTAV